MMDSLVDAYLKIPPHRGKARLTRLALSVFRPHAVRSYYGPVMRTKPHDKTFMFALAGDYGDVVKSHIDTIGENDLFIDIGANYGLFSLYAAIRKPQADIIAFEPNPAIYGALLENIALNRANNILPFHCAIGPNDGLVRLGYTLEHSGRSSVGGDAERTFRVPQFDISRWRVLEELSAGRDIHIKIDVEGYEAEVMKSLTKAAWFPGVKSFVMEVDDAYLGKYGSSAGDIYRAMAQAGFRADGEAGAREHYDEVFRRSMVPVASIGDAVR
jgi:FkbM family methyltransferase